MGDLLVIGAGHWGKNYVRVFAQMLGPEHVAVVDSQAQALEKVRKQYREIRVAGDIAGATAAGSFSMAVVATPAATHFTVIRECLERGLHVLAEKPLTLDVAQAKRLEALARRRGKVLMVGHTFLYNPAVRKMRDLLEKETCGILYYLKATRTHLGLVRPDVNAVWDLAPHDVAIFNYLTGSFPVAASAVGGCFLSKDKEDVAFINLEYPGGVLGNIHVSWADSNKERTVEVVGSKARILFDDLNALERIKIFEKGISRNVAGGATFGEYLFALRDGDIISPKVDSAEPLGEVCKEFLRCAASGAKPLADARNGVEVVKVMCAIEKSLKSGGRRVALRA